MAQALLLSYTIGSLTGPTLTALMMENWSDDMLFVTIALVAGVYLVLLMRKAKQQPTPLAHS